MPRVKNPDSPAPRKRAPRKAAITPATEADYPSFVDPQRRAALIARAAYFRAMDRGFAPGHELQDWLAAEAEVDAELLSGTGKAARV
jgi:hypothetical protein